MHDRLVSRRIDALHQCFLVFYDFMSYELVCMIKHIGAPIWSLNMIWIHS